MSDPRIIVALDHADPKDALEFVKQVDPTRCRVKVGKELFTRTGPAVVEKLVRQDFSVFLDLKYHDIPNTVAGACRAAADLGVWMVNVHALGGRRMMEAAKEATAGARTPPLLVGVTILTSLGQDDLFEVGLAGTALDNVLRLAKLSHDAELHGVVCSPVEIKALRRILPERFVLVTPGIRPAGAESQDQKRVMTPGEAVARGTSYLVVGRPITRAERPMAALEAIEAEIRERSP